MIDKGEFFRTQDRYLFEPFEGAMFFWDHVAETVSMKFIGWDYDTPVPQNHRIFTDAILTGVEISQAEFEAGNVEAR